MVNGNILTIHYLSLTAFFKKIKGMKTAGYTVVLLLLFLTGNAQVHYIDTVQFIDRHTPLPPHPRILLLKGEEEQLKKNIANNPAWKKVHENILLQCDTISPLPSLVSSGICEMRLKNILPLNQP